VDRHRPFGPSDRRARPHCVHFPVGSTGASDVL
jgi:hypothetical protein